MENNEHYIQLIIKQLSKESSAKENKELDTWLETSEQNVALQKKIHSAWNKADGYKSNLHINKDLAWENIENKVSPKATPVRKLNFARVAQIAAMLIVVLGLGFFLSNNLISEDGYYHTTNNVEEIDLPDGSIVWLNKYSELHYSSGFKTRTVEIEGEAYFDVMHNANKPFIVSADGTETRVLGTEFNVNTRIENSDVEVALFEGSVAFKADENNKLILIPGETVQFNKATQSLAKFATNENNLLAWKSGVLEFENTNILNVLNELEEFYEKDLDVSLDSSANCVFTGTFERMEFDEVIEVLSYTYDLNYQDNGENQYLLEIKNCH